MALATSPRETSSYSDDANADDEEAAKVSQSQLNECRKGTATLMLRSNKRLRASCEEQLLSSQGANDSAAGRASSRPPKTPSSDASTPEHDGERSVADSFEAEEYCCENGGVAEGGMEKLAPYARADGPSASRPASSCSSGSCSSSSEIQQHLQSMFSLLRPEETLKMAVKLESLRPGRTRYLVVVSRSVSSKRHSTCSLLLPAGSSGNINTSSWPSSTASLQSSRPSSVLSGPAVHSARHGGAEQGANVNDTTRGFGGALGVDTFVSSHEHCQLSTTTQSSLGGGTSSAASSTALPIASGGNDDCDSKTNTRLSSNTSVAEGDGAEAAAGGLDDAGTKSADCADLANGMGDAGTNCNSSLGQLPQQQLQQSGGLTAIGNGGASTDAAMTADGGKEVEESCLLGIDCNERTTVGLVLKVLADTSIRLDGDGGFSVSSCGKQHIFKPVSVQAMWSALQTLHKFSSKAREHNFFAGGPSHDWVAYYETHIDSDRSCLNEWNAMDSLESRRPPSPGSIRSKPTKREETESVIRSKLKEVMMSVDLDDVTSKFIRGRLEELLDMDLGEFKPFIDGEMLVILGQMDAPTEIFEHVYLGSEWNASNLEELQRNGVRHILNVTREIDNFFPGLFNYFNVRVYDDEKTDLLRHWDNTFKYISRAKMEGSKVLVHCKMGISRSASVVIAYAMKANNWDFQQALQHVKDKRNCIKPNKNFLMQLETYQGMLDAMKNKEKLQRSKSETNLKLAGAKEGRSLPGSEPTPLIQALSGANGGIQNTPGGKRHTVGGIAAAQLPHKIESDEDSVFHGPSKASHRLDELDSHEPTSHADDRLVLDQESRGRSRSRHSHLQPHPQKTKQQALQYEPPQRQLQQDRQPELQSHQQQQQTQDQLRQHTTRPSFSESWRGISTHTAGSFGDGNNRGRPATQCMATTSSSSSRPLKRHKSLSPDTLHPRWVNSHKTATLTASLGLPEATEPVALDRGASEPRANRRKQQSYSLEHLHGLLEMRSPCAETKTIRMPCGNGQNYSVSPNQIVHLQDKLPKASGRSNGTGSSSGVPHTGSFLRRIFSSHYATGETVSVPPADDSSASSHTAAQWSATTSTSSTSSTTTTVPSSAAMPAPTGATSQSGLSSVKTIVCELESSGNNRSSHIPVAPPPSAESGATGTGASSAAIPIASIAAEAAAVAVASANREASRKEHAGGATSSNPVHDSSSSAGRSQHPEQPICWTSSAQIIQQTSTSSYVLPVPSDREDRQQDSAMQVHDEQNKRMAHQDTSGDDSVEAGKGSKTVSVPVDQLGDANCAANVDITGKSKITLSIPISSNDPSSADVGASASETGCHTSHNHPGKVGSLETEQQLKSQSNYVRSPILRPRSCGALEPSGEEVAQSKPDDEPRQHARGSTNGGGMTTQQSGGQSGADVGPSFPADREDIPWHPGTVKRTKEKIEERSSHIGSSRMAASGQTFSLKRTGSSCSSELADNVTVPMSVKVVPVAAPTSSGGTVAMNCSGSSTEGAPLEPQLVMNAPTKEEHSSAEYGGQQQQQQEHCSLHRERRAMVSTNYARLSASAPDSYNMYAGPSASRMTSAASEPAPVGSGTSATSQPTTALKDGQVRFRTSIHGRASVSVGGGPVAKEPLAQSEQAGETLNQAGKVRNLKMSFEAKSNDRRREQKKVRSLPSSPVAVHAQMTGQPRGKPQAHEGPQQPQAQPIGPSKAPLLARQPSTTSLTSQHHAGSPLEDVTVRDLVDRYEVHGPRPRTGSNGGTAPVSTTVTTSTSATVSVAATPSATRPRPRSVFEPLKSGNAQSHPASTASSGVLFNSGKTVPHLLSHATAPFRLEEFSRPPVPPTAPLVRGLLLPTDTAHLMNNNNGAAYNPYVRPGPGVASGSNSARNNNNNNHGSATLGANDGAPGTEGSHRKRAQQHGRTHPLAKISPSCNASKHQQQHQQQYHHHHHHHHHHQYTARIAAGMVTSGPTAAVSGGAPAGSTATANVYNTM